MRQGQTELDLVGGHISVSTALDRTEGVESRAGGASDTEGVHYGGRVVRRGVWVAEAMGVSSCCRRKAANCLKGDAGGARACPALVRAGLDRRLFLEEQRSCGSALQDNLISCNYNDQKHDFTVKLLSIFSQLGCVYGGNAMLH